MPDVALSNVLIFYKNAEDIIMCISVIKKKKKKKLARLIFENLYKNYFHS